MVFSSRVSRVTSIAIGCVAFCLGAIHLGCRSRLEVYKRIDSPNGRYAVVVYRQTGGMRFPGAASDAPGVVILVDNRGRRIREVMVEMVQLVDRVEWSTNSVHIMGVADWPTN